MCAYKLNDDIIFLVYQEVISGHKQSKEGWIACFQLLSVCSSWRRAGLPLVYGSVRVWYTAEKAQLSSNASLIADMGYTHMVKRLNINYKVRKPTINLEPALQLLSNTAPQWPAVKTLYLNTDCGKRWYMLSPGNYAQYISMLGKSVQRLVRLLPNIVNMEFTGALPNKESVRLFQMISNNYVEHVQRIKSSYPIAVADQHYFNWLTHLDIGFDNIGQCSQLEVCVDKLEHLCLRGIPYDFNWACFSREANPKVVFFPMLKSLKFDVNSDYFNPDNPTSDLPMVPKLHFLQLKRLSMEHYCDKFPVLENGIFECEIDYLHLNGTRRSLNNLLTIKLPMINVLSLNFVIRSTLEMAKPLKAFNELCMLARKTANVKLRIEGHTGIAFTKFVASPNLTHLTVNARSYADTIIDIIVNMPKLIEFEIGPYVHDNAYTKFITRPCKNVDTLDSKLRMLKLKYCLSDCNVKNAMEFVNYLQSRLPNLKIIICQENSKR